MIIKLSLRVSKKTSGPIKKHKAQKVLRNVRSITNYHKKLGLALIRKLAANLEYKSLIFKNLIHGSIILKI